jgi:hypothetical protein
MPQKKQPKTRVFKSFESPKDKEEMLQHLRDLGLLKEPQKKPRKPKG